VDFQRTIVDPTVLEAFREYEDEQRIGNTKVGCALVVTLMPAGTFLDYFVYPDEVVTFLELRLLCSALAGLIWAALYTRFGQRSARWLGVVVPMLPVVFIAWMIAITKGFDSPYYAGLNLVLLAIGAVLHWTTRESIVGVSLVLFLYLGACVYRGLNKGWPDSAEMVVNNLYFISLMDVIAVVGTYFYERYRFREFALRYELDKNRRMLEESNRKLLELDQLKSRFFANISHELRTPLTLLLAPLESLLRQKKLQFDSSEFELLRTMQTNGMRLLKLINDLLDLVRLESGRMEVKNEPVALNEFILGLIGSVRKVADDKRVFLEPDLDESIGTLLTDRDKLEKILLNLVFNSIKFTPSGGRVLVESRRENEQLVLNVRDTGMGIAENHLPYIFDRFWQADSSSRRKYQGAGIGLALVKELVEVQGGTVVVESQLGRGSCMTVKLPYVITTESAPAESVSEELPILATGSAPVAPPQAEWLSQLYRRAELFPAMTSVKDSLRPVEFFHSGNKPKILLADDEPDILRFLKAQLTGYFQILEAVDGQQALEKAQQFLPDIVLLDMMMPEKDGLQVCQELRARTPTQNIPIILLTARADEETKLAALAAGASDFLTKPFSTTELHVRLKNLVERYQTQLKLARQNQVLEATLEQLKETEIQLVQSEKLASLGRMSAGIIHEINNPINFAKTGLFTLRKTGALLAEDRRDEFQEVLSDIEEGIDRVKNIVSDLRTFTRPEAGQFEEVDLAKVIEASLRFLSHEWKNKVDVRKDLPDSFVIQGNHNQLVQVFVNLFQNSLDAMKKKPNPTEPSVLELEGKRATGKTLLRIRDNGPGISSQNIGKVFDPFFTTKEIGEGMGLGLSICHRIVQDHGGRILVQSEPGKFCEFTLEFPQKSEQ